MATFNQQNFSDYTVLESRQVASGSVSRKFMARVFMWMFLALSVSAVVAVLFSSIPALSSLIFVQTFNSVHFTLLGNIVSFSPLAFVLLITFGYQRLSVPALTSVFLLFAVAMGMSLSVWLWLYTESSVFSCFASSAAMFGIMAVMGYTTDKDLTRFGSILTMGLIGIIVASMINFLLHSNALYYIISFLGVAIFTGLTAYDVQKLKRIGAGIEFEGVSAANSQKLALMGALSLYLDFINLFLYMLRIFGDRRK